MSKNSLQNNEVRAVSKYIRMSPSKVRRVLRQIQGKSYKDALILLEFMPYASCEPIIKVLRSAAANAQNNLNLNETELFVKSACKNCLYCRILAITVIEMELLLSWASSV